MPAEGEEATVCGAFIVTDDATGLARAIDRIQVGGKLRECLPEIVRFNGRAFFLSQGIIGNPASICPAFRSRRSILSEACQANENLVTSPEKPFCAARRSLSTSVMNWTVSRKRFGLVDEKPDRFARIGKAHDADAHKTKTTIIVRIFYRNAILIIGETFSFNYKDISLFLI